MKNVSFLIFAITLTLNINLFSQDFNAVDNKVQNYPDSFSNPDKLAKLINDDFKLPEDKARAFYTWIALNIVYDTEPKTSSRTRTSYSYKTQEEKLQKERKIREDLAKQTIKKRKAVCQGYATLYKYLCDWVSLECEIITGTAKTRDKDIGEIPYKTNHAWNAVKINNEWKLIDATWGAGYTDMHGGQFIKEFTDIYFFTDPEKFFLKHYPENPNWLLTKKSGKDFANLPLYYRDYFNLNVNIVEPTKGIVKLSRKKTIKIVLRNSENENVSFQFSNENKSKTIKPNIKKDLCYYIIKPGSGAYLTIYINYGAFATFKIERN